LCSNCITRLTPQRLGRHVGIDESWCDNTNENAAPIPRDAPVTSTFLPVKSVIVNPRQIFAHYHAQNIPEFTRQSA